MVVLGQRKCGAQDKSGAYQARQADKDKFEHDGKITEAEAIIVPELRGCAAHKLSLVAKHAFCGPPHLPPESCAHDVQRLGLVTPVLLGGNQSLYMSDIDLADEGPAGLASLIDVGDKEDESENSKMKKVIEQAAKFQSLSAIDRNRLVHKRVCNLARKLHQSFKATNELKAAAGEINAKYSGVKTYSLTRFNGSYLTFASV